MAKQYWLHRISWEQDASYPLIDKGYLSVGFSDFADEEFIEKVADGDWNYLDEAFDKEWGERPRTRYTLWRFLAQMKEGDWVVVPSWSEFSVYEVVGKPLLPSELPDDLNCKSWGGKTIVCDKKSGFLVRKGKEAKPIDLGFFRKVKPIISHASRADFADAALTARMKVRQTNVNIDDLADSVERAVKSAKAGEPVRLSAILRDNFADKYLDTIRSTLNPDKFEKLVQRYLEHCGASDAFIPAKNSSNKEGDADVVATFEALRTIIYVQVKFHLGESNDWAVEQIEDFATSQTGIDDGYSRQYWVISLCDSFDEAAVHHAIESHVILIDGKTFTKMLMDAGLEAIGDL